MNHDSGARADEGFDKPEADQLDQLRAAEPEQQVSTDASVEAEGSDGDLADQARTVEFDDEARG